MSYKRVVKKKGKVYGPYVYESYRDEEGNVKKRYLGKQEVKKKIPIPSVLLVGVLALFLIVGIGYTTDFLFNDAEVSGNIFDLAMDFFIDTYSGFTGLIVGETEVAEIEETVEVEEIEEVEEEIAEAEAEAEAVEEIAGAEAEEAEGPEIEEIAEEEPIEEEIAVEQIEESEAEMDVVENETLADINETIVNETLELNETLINETLINETVDVNETILNETLINETIIDINETLINETLELNETIVNETIVEENITLINDTILNESVVFVVENFTTLQYRAVINKPVKWLKKINVSEVENLNIEIPKLAENISVLINGEVEEAEREMEDYDSLIDEVDKEDIVSGVLTGYVAMDINLGRGFFTRIWDWILSFRISGNVILEEELEANEEIVETSESKVIDVKEIANKTNAKKVAVEYYTPAPVSVEVNFSGGKLVKISADDVYNYTDILAYSLIEGMGISIEDSSKLNVYWRASYEDAVRYGYIEEELVSGEELVVGSGSGEGGLQTTNYKLQTKKGNESLEDVGINETKKDKKNKTTGVGNDKKSLITGNIVGNLPKNKIENVSDYVRVSINFTSYDLDEDGYIDYVEWIVPHLSEQVYEISITILNVQSYPTVGGNWTVGFNVTGGANLTISAFNGTTFGFEQENSSVDLEFLELKCGDEVKNVSVLINGTAVPYDIYLKKKRIEEIRRLLG